MPDDKMNVVEYVRPIGVRGNDKLVEFSGTGFGIEKRGLVLTAAHVVAHAVKPEEIYLQPRNGKFLRAHSMNLHPTADVAALAFNTDQSALSR